MGLRIVMRKSVKTLEMTRLSRRVLLLALSRGGTSPPSNKCLVQVGNGIELEAVGFLFKPYLWRPCGVTWD